MKKVAVLFGIMGIYLYICLVKLIKYNNKKLQGMKTLSNIFSVICGISILGFGMNIAIRTILNIAVYDFTSFMVYTSLGLLLVFLGVCVPIVSWEK